MTAEEDEGQEDVLALEIRRAVVPAPSRGDGGEAGDAEEAVADGSPSPPEPGDRAGGRAAGGLAAERAGWTAGGIAAEPSGQNAGETAEERPGPTAGEGLADVGGETVGLWKDGPVWTVRDAVPGMDAAQALVLTERTVQMAEEPWTARNGGDVAALAGQTAAAAALGGAGWAVRGGTAELVLDGARQAARSRAGLEGLYRQAVQAARPAAPVLAPGQAERTVRVPEPGSAASLAVDELDRAVRRDSRRYDGGMTIY